MFDNLNNQKNSQNQGGVPGQGGGLPSRAAGGPNSAPLVGANNNPSPAPTPKERVGENKTSANPNPNQGIGGNAKLPEDIFAGTNDEQRSYQSAPKPQAFEPKTVGSVDNLAQEESQAQTQKLYFLVASVLGFVLICILGFWGYKIFSNANNGAVLIDDYNNDIVDDGIDNKVDDAGQDDLQQAQDDTPVTVEPTDTDQDGLTDEVEAELGTDSTSPDSDNDGLFDRQEVELYHTDPMNSDTDNDGISDGEEVKSGSDPKGEGRLYDIDGTPEDKTTTSSEEVTGEVDEIVPVDSDSDGLLDLDETENYKTDPKNSDTDGDGLGDGDEINKYKTNPLNSDTDGDSYSDGDEVKNGYNPNGEGELAI